MADQSPNPRSRIPHLQSLTDEILSIRTELAPAIQDSNRLRAEASRLNAAAITIDQRVASLEQRLRQAETTQRQVLHHYSSYPVNLPAGNTSPGYTRGLTPVAPFGGGQYHGPAPPPPRSFQLPFHQSSPLNGAQALADPNLTPRAAAAPPHATQGPNKKRSNNQNTVHYLPSVIERILAEGNQYQKRKETCDVVVEQQGNSIRNCQRHLYSVHCFREDHFRFCGKHMRTIARGQYTCAVGSNRDCLPVIWEERDDWESMVEQAYKAGNFGNRNVDPDQLKRALLPPIQYPHRYT